jgi:FAD/FMN-containing dehydrogenase
LSTIDISLTLSSMLDALRAVVGPSHIITDEELLASYLSDWTGRFRGPARAVARPGDTAEVAEVIRLCAKAACPIRIQGGNTGLVGGATPGQD